MAQALLVTVRFYEGRYHGADDWPPAPARLFQALLAGAARGATVPSAVEEALDWLETLPPPAIAAPRGIPGQGYTAFVPNNDLDAELSKRETPRLDDAVAAIRVGKHIRPILFDGDIPLLYHWSIDDADDRAVTLCKASAGLYRLGRGVDMAWAEAAVIDAEAAEERLFHHGGIVYRPTDGESSGLDLLCPCPGLRRTLARRFEAMRHRFRRGGSNRRPLRIFAQPPRPLLAKVAYDAPAQPLSFELRESDVQADFAPWPLSKASELVQNVRDQAAGKLCKAAPSLAKDVERYLIGRGATGADKAVRIHIVPLPSVGHEHATMAIRRIVVYVPPSCPLKAEDLAWVLAQVAWTDEDGVIVRELQSADDMRMARYFEGRGRCWQSVTPLALPMAWRRRINPARRAEEAKSGAERAAEEARAAAAVRQALRHAGIRIPAVNMRVQREPFHRRGQRAEAFAPGTRFPKEALWHASLTFATPLAGPLLLGDGRYLGLGLMLPEEEPMRDVLAFAITDGLADGAAPAPVAQAARRATMARVQNNLSRGERLPPYVSGHNEDGSPAGGGIHRHIAIVADLPRRRILYLAPNRLQRHGVKWREIERDHDRMARALEGMDTLRAGRAGLLRLAPAQIDEDDDPLFAPSRVWESVTDYDVTRHSRRLGDEEALKTDAATELRRCGWPSLPPEAIVVLALRRGPRGGLAGSLRCTFPTAQAGPLAIGRSAHKGGGLFAGRRFRSV